MADSTGQTATDYEKLGVFYLGKRRDIAAGKTTEDLVLYDSKDLTTHAMCVGMTGSGKTGLCLSLLEEAAIDGIPVIAIDPKGDLGNLLLTFPDLKASDFRPWIDESAAARAGQTPDDFAAETAKTWAKGLESWNQSGQRIARFRDAADVAIYTPGGSAGLPLNVLKSFDSPPKDLLDQREILQEKLQGAAQSLLALLGMDADPVRSREHILITSILEKAWREGRNLSLAKLVQEIQSPPFERVGVLDLETFFPAGDRVQFSLLVNNLLASTAFAGWMEGEPLDIQRLMYTPSGKPRISILSIAHLTDSERMFFVTLLLGEVLTWMRKQPGTSSLRAILYMDEIFGYFPPIGEPPSKRPMLTLLKQARAFGLGLMLCTQNPVDLDYKGLSNCGTWFLGRLQTERDKMRVLEGLEGASASAGKTFDRAEMEQTLAGLSARVFLMNNVHDDQHVIFQTRWALSYLAGPLSSTQIRTLMGPRKAATSALTNPNGPASETSALANSGATQRAIREAAKPVFPPDIPEVFIGSGPVAGGAKLVYRPMLLGQAKLHFTQAGGIDHWQDHSYLAYLDEEAPGDVWDAAQAYDTASLECEQKPVAAGEFIAPTGSVTSKLFKVWDKDFRAFLYRTEKLVLFRCAELKQVSNPGESEGDFRARLSQGLRERRDLESEKLKKKYQPRFAQEQERLRKAEERLSREKSQATQTMITSMASMGASVLGALLGNRLASKTNVSKAATSVNSMTKAMKERGDIGRAEEGVDAIQERMRALEDEFKKQIEQLDDKVDAAALPLEQIQVTPKKADISVERLALAWLPFQVDATGLTKPVYTAKPLQMT